MASFTSSDKKDNTPERKFPIRKKKFEGKRNNFHRNSHVVYTDVFFIPKGIKKIVDNLFDRGLGSYEFLKEIKKEIRSNSNIWKSTVIYIINEAACRDKLEIIELILDKLPDREKIVNAKCGPKEFTPIFKSAYKGSIRALKILLCAGSDITIKNKMGETVMQALEQGNIDTNNRNPTFKIFTDERYNECRDFLNNWNPNKKKGLTKNLKAYKPPNKRNVLTLNDKSYSKRNVLPNDTPDDEKDYKNMTNATFLNVYKSENDIIDFIKTKKTPNETLIEIIIESAEKSQDVYCNMMSIISELPYDIISNFINNETFIDYVMYDAPYTKKKFNELREKYSFKIID